MTEADAVRPPCEPAGDHVQSTLRVWLRAAAAVLHTAGVDGPRASAELLAVHGLGLRRLDVLLMPERALALSEVAVIDELLARRLRGEPVAYIVGEREFYGRAMAVSPATLIPRPETEHLVEQALNLLPAAAAVRFADMGTGSGCVAITLAAERPLWHGLAVDVALPALRVACANAIRHAIMPRLHLVCADMTRPLLAPASLDLLVSNPPYVSRPEYAALSPEVRDFEPEQALVPVSTDPCSPRGLEHLAALVGIGAQALRPGGWLCLEHGWEQARELALLFSCNVWENVQCLQDLAGKDRITFARRRPTDRVPD